jgi:murein DD-endopeptidase MepM/ murein hydrolase activator NlpD
MKKGLKLIVVMIALMMLVNSAEASEVDNLKRELENTEREISNITQKLRETQSKKNDVENQINILDKEILTLSSEELKLELLVLDFESKIQDKEIEINQIEDDIVRGNDLLEQRLRVMYKNGAVGYLEVLFNSSDIGDFLTRIDMIQRIVGNDVSILEELEDMHNLLEVAKLELENEKNNHYIAMQDIKTKRQDIEIASRAKETYMQSLVGSLDELKRQENKLLQASDEIEKKIQLAQLATKYAGGEMTWPAPGYYTITSPYGMRAHPLYGYWSMHTGVDLRVPMNQKIVAANAGTVTYSGWYGAYGNIVLIDHGGGISTLYAHNTTVIVKDGQVVSKGQVVSYSGTTGMSTGPHLHFEVRENGVHTNPMTYFQ